MTTDDDLLGHRFTDSRYAAWATSSSSRAFGSLETLGDAIADFAVAVTCWRNGIDAAEAARRVGNDALDAIHRRHLNGRVDARSGDVVEALVGAVHLDAGFETAAAFAVRWCSPDLGWEPLGDHPVDDWVTVDDVDLPASLAASALDALVTDLIVTPRGPTVTTQKSINRARVRIVDGPGRSRLSRRLGLRRSEPSGGLAEPLRAAVLATLLAAGWDRTRALLAPHVTPGP